MLYISLSLVIAYLGAKFKAYLGVKFIGYLGDKFIDYFEGNSDNFNRGRGILVLFLLS